MTQTDLPQTGGLSGMSPLRTLPRPLEVKHLPLATALLTLAAFAIAEAVTVHSDPFTGIALHGVTLFVLLAVSGIGGRSDAAEEHPLSRLLFALALVPLIRIVSLTMPLARFEETYWFVAAGAPVFLAAVVVMSALGLRLRDIGLRAGWRTLPLQLTVALFGFALGLGEYHILRARCSDRGSDAETGRRARPHPLVRHRVPGGVHLQGHPPAAATAALGRPAIVYVSLIFAILHIGYRSATDLLFVFLIALLYGWVVRRTGSIMGVSVSHGITNITLFLLMPFVSVLSAQPDWLPPLK